MLITPNSLTPKRISPNNKSISSGTVVELKTPASIIIAFISLPSTFQFTSTAFTPNFSANPWQDNTIFCSNASIYALHRSAFILGECVARNPFGVDCPASASLIKSTISFGITSNPLSEINCSINHCLYFPSNSKFFSWVYP